MSAAAGSAGLAEWWIRRSPTDALADARQALQCLQERAVPAVPWGVLARRAAQVSHEHHPARAADRDGNDGQRDGEGRAGRQTLPEQGVGGGPHQRADRDRGREAP